MYESALVVNGSLKISEHVPNEEGDRQQKRVEAVEEPTVAWQQAARILFKQVRENI